MFDFDAHIVCRPVNYPKRKNHKPNKVKHMQNNVAVFQLGVLFVRDNKFKWNILLSYCGLVLRLFILCCREFCHAGNCQDQQSEILLLTWMQRVVVPQSTRSQNRKTPQPNYQLKRCHPIARSTRIKNATYCSLRNWHWHGQKMRESSWERKPDSLKRLLIMVLYFCVLCFACLFCICWSLCLHDVMWSVPIWRVNILCPIEILHAVPFYARFVYNVLWNRSQGRFHVCADDETEIRWNGLRGRRQANKQKQKTEIWKPKMMPSIKYINNGRAKKQCTSRRMHPTRNPTEIYPWQTAMLQPGVSKWWNLFVKQLPRRLVAN